MKNYKAPWSKSLVVVSALITLLCLGVSAGMIFSGHRLLPWVALGPLVIVLGGALFIIRGYTVTPDAILVHRSFWTTRLPLAGLRSVESMPDAMRRSIRLFGNGGLFSFTGFFRNRDLGGYRAFVTDPQRTVVLRFRTRTVVLSPSAPTEFVQDIAVMDHGG